MKRVSWLLQFLLVVLLTLPVALVPYRLSLKVGEALGSVLFFIWGSRRRIAIENLKGAISRGALIVNSSPESVIKQNFRNLGKSFVEVIKIYYGLGDRIIENVEIRGIERFRKAIGRGAGAILVSGHCGNWELKAIAFSVKVSPFSVVARPINNPFLNYVVERVREKYGNHVIYKKGALKEILLLLKRNGAAGILMDQSVLASEGLITDFLGKKDYTMKTPALLAMKTGSAVIPGFLRRAGDGHVLEIGEEITLDKSDDADKDLVNNTIKFQRHIEEYIRQNPSEWLWMHRRWKRIPQ